MAARLSEKQGSTHFGEKWVAQFLAVCRASTLAETLRISALLRHQCREKRGALSRSTRIHICQLQPKTNTEKLRRAVTVMVSKKETSSLPLPFKDQGQIGQEKQQVNGSLDKMGSLAGKRQRAHRQRQEQQNHLDDVHA